MMTLGDLLSHLLRQTLGLLSIFLLAASVNGKTYPFDKSCIGRFIELKPLINFNETTATILPLTTTPLPTETVPGGNNGGGNGSSSSSSNANDDDGSGANSGLLFGLGAFTAACVAGGLFSNMGKARHAELGADNGDFSVLESALSVPGDTLVDLGLAESPDDKMFQVEFKPMSMSGHRQAQDASQIVSGVSPVVLERIAAMQ